MRIINSKVAVVVMLFAIACTDGKEEKKADQPSKDTLTTVVDTPLVETIFPDTIVATPVKESVLLKFNFQKDKVYNYAMNFDVSQNNGEQKRSTLMKWNYDMEVLESEKDVKTIKVTYKKIEMTADMGGQQLEFNSEKKVDAMDFMQLPSRMFGIIKGKSFTMQVNDKGEIVSVTGFDKILEAVLTEGNLPPQLKPMMEQTFKKEFGDEKVKEMFSQWFSVYPNKAIKIGDSWKSSTAIAGLNQSASTVYTVKNIKGNQVFVGGLSKLTDGRVILSKLIIDVPTGLMINGTFDQRENDPGKSTIKSRITGKQL